MLLLVILVVIILIIRDKLKYGQRKEAYSLTCMLCFYVLFMLDMLLQIFNMPEMSDILSKKNINLSYVACVLPATLLHLNERSNIWPPSNVPIWVGALLQSYIDMNLSLS